MGAENILLIEGLADYSIISESKFYEQNNYLLLFGNFLKNKLNQNLKLIDFRIGNISFSDLSSQIKEFQPLIIIIAIYNYNIRNAINLSSKLKSPNIFLFTDDLYLHDYYSKNNVEYNFILFDKRETIEKNLRKIVNDIFPSSKILKFDYDPYYWNVTNLYTKNATDIVVGTGCEEKCSFCYFNSSKTVFNSPAIVIEEIKYLLKHNVHYFRIRNHNILSNINFVKELCRKLIEQFSSYDFAWSCCIMPQYIENFLVLLPLLKKAKLENVELELYHVNEAILNSYNINFKLNQVEHLIYELNHWHITSISINYLMHSKLENNATLNELIEYSKKLIIIAPGMIEYNLKSNETIIENIQLKNNIKKKNKIDELKRIFFQQCLTEQTRTYENISSSQKIRHIKLAEKGCLSSYYLYYISKSAIFSIYKLRILNPTLRYSWEIEDNILEYTPLIFMKYVYIGSYKMLKMKKQTFLLTEYFFNLYCMAKEYKSIRSMIDYMCLKYPSYSMDENKRKILNFFLKLENWDISLFMKCLK